MLYPHTVMSRKLSCKIVSVWGCFIICIIILALESRIMTFLVCVCGRAVSIWISLSPLKKDLSRLSVHFKSSNGQVTADDWGGGFLKALLFLLPFHFYTHTPTHTHSHTRTPHSSLLPSTPQNWRYYSCHWFKLILLQSNDKINFHFHTYAGKQQPLHHFWCCT